MSRMEGEMPTSLRFAKGQALGNDYLVVEEEELPWPLTPERVRRFCDRHRGAGSDGVLLAGGSEDDAFRLRIFNPDGSEAEKSGNGLRIFAAYLHARGRVGSERFRVRLPTDTVEMTVEGPADEGGVVVTVAMGRARFRGDAVGFRPEAGEVLGRELELDGAGTAAVHLVSLGNPHCVVRADALERGDFLRRAPRLATHPAFAAGTNVQFARPTGPATLEAWIWERGAGETLASGSSACAVAAVGLRMGWVTSRDLTVEMPGGSVAVSVDPEWNVRLTGPAQMVYWAVAADGLRVEG